MGIKGLTALISEHAPKAIRVRGIYPPLLSFPDRRDARRYTGTRYQEPLRSQSRHRRVHVHLPISYRRTSKGRRDADERRWRDNKVWSPSHILH
jgi:hypothetical protein